MSFELIETIEVGADGAASIEFTSIPQDGTDLVLKLSARATTESRSAAVRFNGDSATNYKRIELSGSGDSVFSFSSAGLSRFFMRINRSDQTSSTFGNSSAYISNYSSTTDKSISVEGVNENNATGADAMIAAHSYVTSSAITSIEITDNSLGNLVAGSTASLYKITAA